MKYTGDCWTGPIDGVCSSCGKSGRVEQLARYKADEEVERYQKFSCTDCLNARSREWKAERKAQLAAEPRCQVPGCRMRGTWRAGSVDQVLLCGRHLKAAKAEHYKRASQGLGGLALFMGAEVSGPEVLNMVAKRP